MLTEGIIYHLGIRLARIYLFYRGTCRFLLAGACIGSASSWCIEIRFFPPFDEILFQA